MKLLTSHTPWFSQTNPNPYRYNVKRERERERERETERDRDRETETDRQTERETPVFRLSGWPKCVLKLYSFSYT